MEGTTVQMMKISQETTFLQCDSHTSSIFATFAGSQTPSLHAAYNLLNSQQELYIF